MFQLCFLIFCFNFPSWQCIFVESGYLSVSSNLPSVYVRKYISTKLHFSCQTFLQSPKKVSKMIHFRVNNAFQKCFLLKSCIYKCFQRHWARLCSSRKRVKCKNEVNPWCRGVCASGEKQRRMSGVRRKLSPAVWGGQLGRRLREGLIDVIETWVWATKRLCGRWSMTSVWWAGSCDRIWSPEWYSWRVRFQSSMQLFHCSQLEQTVTRQSHCCPLL